MRSMVPLSTCKAEEHNVEAGGAEHAASAEAWALILWVMIQEVSVLEGDSVILHTDVDRKQEDRITWYFNNIRIAQISGGQSKICTDVGCPQRFGDKLNLKDSSLMITNINTSDAGVYKLQIASRNIEKTFSITVHERDQMNRKSVKEGESVTLNPGAIKTNDLITWYFNDIRIAGIKAVNTSTNVHSVADETFRVGLKLDNQNGSLIITNSRTTDSGLYKLQISSSRFSIIRSINVTVTELAREHFCALVLLLLLFPVAAAAITSARKGNKQLPNQTDTFLEKPPNGMPPKQTDAASEISV